MHLSRKRFPSSTETLGKQCFLRVVFEIGLGKLAVLFQREKSLRREGYAATASPAPPQIMSAAQTRRTEEPLRSYPEQWLQHRQALERLMLAAVHSRVAAWGGHLHHLQKKNVNLACLGSRKEPVDSGKKSDDDEIEEDTGQLMGVPLGPVLAHPDERRDRRELLPIPRRTPAGGGIEELGDRYPFLGGVKGSTTLVDPGKFTLIVTSNYSIEQFRAGLNQSD
jgi:hypothetical protein